MRRPSTIVQTNGKWLRKLIPFLGAGLLLATQLQAECTYSKPLQAVIANQTNVLSWSTQKEENNDFFVIERSQDGVSFEKAVIMEGAGNSEEEKNYRFVDISNESKRTFYRLLQVDYDGTTTMTHTLIVTQQEETPVFDITAMSASTTDRFFSLIVDSSIDHEMEYRVMDLMGEIKKEGTSQVIQGTNALSIDLAELEVGSFQFALKVKNQLEILNIRKVDSKELPDVNLARQNTKN
ncbi:MAG: hypothetical protein AAFV95_07240 [Bacteroidota bacterium]